MTTDNPNPSVQQTITIRLGDTDYTITPTMRFVYGIMSTEDMIRQLDKNPEVIRNVTDQIMDTLKAGTARHHNWDEVRESVMDMTFNELVDAIRDATGGNADSPLVEQPEEAAAD